MQVDGVKNMGDNKKSLGKKIRIYLVDDHPIFRRGLAYLINSEADLEVCGEAEDYLEGLNGIKKENPDLAIIDISLKSSSGMELIRDVRIYCPGVHILALSMHDENIYAERVLRTGAMGYLMKQEAPETIISALRRILGGRAYVSENISSKMINRMVDGGPGSKGSPVDVLSDRELEVFRMVGSGMSTKAISEKLNVSIKTVENHRAHIKEKLDLKNSIELIQQATLWVQGENK
jgi:DNA-binding NarL/FixJ family response regulator